MRDQVLTAALMLDAELPDSPLAQLIAYRTRRVFATELSDDGRLSRDGLHELGLLTAVMYEQIEVAEDGVG